MIEKYSNGNASIQVEQVGGMAWSIIYVSIIEHFINFFKFIVSFNEWTDMCSKPISMSLVIQDFLLNSQISGKLDSNIPFKALRALE